MSFNKIINSIYDEYERASAKFGPFASSHEGYAVILEELEEAWKAIKENDPITARNEMVQVAAMAIRFLTDIEE